MHSGLWRNRGGKAGELCKSSRVLIDKLLACCCIRRAYVLVLYVGGRLESMGSYRSVGIPYAPPILFHYILRARQVERSHNHGIGYPNDLSLCSKRRSGVGSCTSASRTEIVAGRFTALRA